MVDAQNKVLVVDQEETACNFLKDSLSEEGYSITISQNGKEALEKINQEFFNVVILDLSLPEAIIAKIMGTKKKENVRPMFIVTTTSSSPETLQKTTKLEAYDYVIKPFRKVEVVFSVKRALETQKLVLANQKLCKELQASNIKLGEEKEAERAQKLSAIYQIGKEISSTLNLQKVLNIIVERTVRILDSEIISILLVHESGTLVIKKSIGLDYSITQGTKIKLGDKITGWVAKNKKPLLIQDIEKDSRFSRKNHERYYTNSLISAPLLVKGKILGVINVNNKKSRGVYTQEDLDFLESIASQAAIAIRNAQLYSDLGASYTDSICAITNALEVRDPFSYGHSSNVTDYSRYIAEELDLPNDKKEIIVHAALLHDIGKIAISDAILLKPDKLTEAEWEIVKEHPRKGKEILEPLSFLKDALPIVLHHHERYDGKGYPDSIQGESIPLGARIISVADTYDAMSSDRPYRKRLSDEICIAELKKVSGTQLDPHIVEAFLKILERKIKKEKA